ncbi:MAG TPA: protein phosphatase 2C domain-containing protein [Kofleriaceae bacterium]|nr:protein phosphatase 2C domain-containing protein [Kofleriaceae bacterium]
MAGRASIVGAAETSVGKVRDHNEDAHFIDPEAGILIVCDGMGGHAAGEVASALAVKTIRNRWSSEGVQRAIDSWHKLGTAEARKQLILAIQKGVVDAHDAIVAEAEADRGKAGMGTTLVGAIVVGGDVVFAHCGDSRAYIVRDNIAMQLTEDHTLLARLLAAGVDVDVDGDGMRFKSMLTNALGIGQECKVSTFIVPVADGDRFLLCSDGITEYVKEHEVGEVLSSSASPARACQRLVEMALARGGGDNATALVVRVLEAGETSRPAELLRREERAIHSCPLWAKVNPQQRLRALRIALPRDYALSEKLPAQTLGDRVAWIIVEGDLEQDGHVRGPGSLIYPEALLTDRPLPDKDGLAVAQSDIRVLAIRSDDFRELCEDDPELGEALLAALAAEIQLRRPHRRTGKIVVNGDGEERSGTDPGLEPTMPGLSTFPRARTPTDRGVSAVARAPTIPPPVDSRAGTEPPARISSPRLSRGSTPPLSSLIQAPTDVEGDLDRALLDLTADKKAVATKQLEPADDEDAEISVEPRKDDTPVPKTEAKRSPNLSEPEISIEALEDEADAAPVEVLKDTSSQKITMTSDASDPEIVVAPLANGDSGPERPRPKRQTDQPD